MVYRHPGFNRLAYFNNTKKDYVWKQHIAKNERAYNYKSIGADLWRRKVSYFRQDADKNGTRWEKIIKRERQC